MAGIGNQQVSYAYRMEATSQLFNNLYYGVLDKGIYSGAELSKAAVNTTTEFVIQPGTFLFQDDDSDVMAKITTKEAVTIDKATYGFDNDHTLVVARFSWINTENNFMTFLCVSPTLDNSSSDHLHSKDIVIAKLSLTELELLDDSLTVKSLFNTELRTIPGVIQGQSNTVDNFRAYTIPPYTNSICISSGVINTLAEQLTFPGVIGFPNNDIIITDHEGIIDKVSVTQVGFSTVTTGQHRKDIICVEVTDDSIYLKVIEGSPVALVEEASAPDHLSRKVICEIDVRSDREFITPQDIKLVSTTVDKSTNFGSIDLNTTSLDLVISTGEYAFKSTLSAPLLASEEYGLPSIITLEEGQVISGILQVRNNKAGDIYQILQVSDSEQVPYQLFEFYRQASGGGVFGSWYSLQTGDVDLSFKDLLLTGKLIVSDEGIFGSDETINLSDPVNANEDLTTNKKLKVTSIEGVVENGGVLFADPTLVDSEDNSFDIAPVSRLRTESILDSLEGLTPITPEQELLLDGSPSTTSSKGQQSIGEATYIPSRLKIDNREFPNINTIHGNQQGCFYISDKLVNVPWEAPEYWANSGNIHKFGKWLKIPSSSNYNSLFTIPRYTYTEDTRYLPRVGVLLKRGDSGNLVYFRFRYISGEITANFNWVTRVFTGNSTCELDQLYDIATDLIYIIVRRKFIDDAAFSTIDRSFSVYPNSGYLFLTDLVLYKSSYAQLISYMDNNTYPLEVNTNEYRNSLQYSFDWATSFLSINFKLGFAYEHTTEQALLLSDGRTAYRDISVATVGKKIRVRFLKTTYPSYVYYYIGHDGVNWVTDTDIALVPDMSEAIFRQSHELVVSFNWEASTFSLALDGIILYDNEEIPDHRKYDSPAQLILGGGTGNFYISNVCVHPKTMSFSEVYGKLYYDPASQYGSDFNWRVSPHENTKTLPPAIYRERDGKGRGRGLKYTYSFISPPEGYSSVSIWNYLYAWAPRANVRLIVDEGYIVVPASSTYGGGIQGKVESITYETPRLDGYGTIILNIIKWNGEYVPLYFEYFSKEGLDEVFLTIKASGLFIDLSTGLPLFGHVS